MSVSSAYIKLGHDAETGTLDDQAMALCSVHPTHRLGMIRGRTG